MELLTTIAALSQEEEAKPAEGEEGDEGDVETKETPEVAAPQLNGVNLSDQEARTSLLALVKTHCCWGSGVVKQMRITGMDYVPAYHYEIQTFAEKRETNWVCGPHKGLDMDSATSGRAPLPWEIDCPPSSVFKEEVRVVTVPHTGVVKTCHKCRGNGGMTCNECYGKVRQVITNFGNINTLSSQSYYTAIHYYRIFLIKLVAHQTMNTSVFRLH